MMSGRAGRPHDPCSVIRSGSRSRPIAQGRLRQAHVLAAQLGSRSRIGPDLVCQPRVSSDRSASPGLRHQAQRRGVGVEQWHLLTGRRKRRTNHSGGRAMGTIAPASDRGSLANEGSLRQWRRLNVLPSLHRRVCVQRPSRLGDQPEVEQLAVDASRHASPASQSKDVPQPAPAVDQQQRAMALAQAPCARRQFVVPLGRLDWDDSPLHQMISARRAGVPDAGIVQRLAPQSWRGMTPCRICVKAGMISIDVNVNVSWSSPVYRVRRRDAATLQHSRIDAPP